jgi:diketogulonate reductase-like aldo/keto reductase
MGKGPCGKGLKGVRHRVFLMRKVYTHGRDKERALRMLDQSLRRLQTDRLDLWQVHGVSFENDPDLFIRPGGAAEALAPMSPAEMQSLCDRCHFDASDGRWGSKDTL